MIIFALTGFAICLVVGFAVAFRLLYLARITRGTPELMWGLCWLTFGLSNVLELLTTALSHKTIAYALYLALYSLTTCSVWIATWQVFRPKSRWTASLVTGACLAVIIGYIAQAIGPGFDLTALGVVHMNTPQQWLIRILTPVALLWACIEAVFCYRDSRRRARYGLGSALESFRYIAWICSAMSINVVFVTVYFTSTDNAPAWMSLVAQPAFGMLGAVFMWIAFFPPGFINQMLLEGKGT